LKLLKKRQKEPTTTRRSKEEVTEPQTTQPVDGL